MSVTKDNVKNLKRTKGVLKCKCGSTRYDIEVHCGDDADADWGDWHWIDVSCRACGKTLFYNGA